MRLYRNPVNNPTLARVSVVRRPATAPVPFTRPASITKAAAQVGSGGGRMVIGGIGIFGVSGATPRSVTPTTVRLASGKVVTPGTYQGSNGTVVVGSDGSVTNTRTGKVTSPATNSARV